ncbi:hypothetical protein E1193_22055 [Micromonospora sp. KC606]|uniref:Rv0361 family membrane protein n=1 Tax=Micromonospora sp. KC606 TaxID=2530379 RepID=UPI00104597A5|nr:hypothetical protein [Micromonospora sp. KC606]TDC77673.1 hypothetical protein E1193_22055 [Micromonospora sp. KC606]
MNRPPTGGVTGPASSPSSGPASPGTAASYPAHRPATGKLKRSRLAVSLTIAAALLLCGGGTAAAYLALPDREDGAGAVEPAVAVDNFLSAVYQDRDARRAAGFVCAASRDQQKIAAKVAEVDRYASGHANPRFRWATPRVDNQTGDRATVSARVVMTTADEKIAEQALRFTVVREKGWWVCEVA